MEARIGSNAASITDADGYSGTYVLRELIREIPLSTDEDGVRAHITCVDTWNGNLYIGTSVGEVLHYVSIPATADAEEQSGQPSYIFATKLEPAYSTKQQGSDAGVKQILLLPDAAKACILCNGTLTFYTLPELSPAFGGRIQQAACLWIGGIDLNEGGDDKEGLSAPVIILCLRQKLRLIRIGEDPRKIRDIELPGVSAIQRRGDLACVADRQSYALLDVVNQRKIDLFPISSLNVPDVTPPLHQELAPRTREASRSFSTASPVRQGRGHERIVSLGAAPSSSDRLRPDSGSPWPARKSSRQASSPGQPSSREESPAKAEDGAETMAAQTAASAESAISVQHLRPNLATPTPNEFLLTTGTKLSEPGVGVFVNLEGDVVRGTIEFSSYPESMVLDVTGQLSPNGLPDQPVQEGFVLSVVRRKAENGFRKAIEIQRWDVDPTEAQQSKEWLPFGPLEAQTEDKTDIGGTGLRIASSGAELDASATSKSLRLRRLRIESDVEESEVDAKRNKEEDRFATRFSQARSHILFYHGDKVFWVLRNALLEQLERQLDFAVQHSRSGEMTVDVAGVQLVLNSIRGQDARDELEFLSLTYIRQKASLILFGNLVMQTANGFVSYERDKRFTEEALVDGEIDPRCILTLVPPLSDEVIGGEQGIWLSQGLRDTITNLRGHLDPSQLIQDSKGAYGDNLLQVLKRYLLTWRKKKGFGSVADESHVFDSVDAALLHVLLMLDQNSPRGPATAGSVRAELNDVVDRGIDCFDRAAELFERYDRLYMLSRLYQSRKNVAQVLATWKRILEGEKDLGGELTEGEQDLRRYLAKIRDAALVQDYGSWLANRNPKLGVQIFADDSSRVKFQPAEAVAILKERAPGAVKEYLEHLVFGKNHTQYVNDLISFYLDTVLGELERTEDAKHTLLQSYETYRALHPPKPTYSQFIADNTIDTEWWHNRLRLLQLIGGSHGAASKYDVHNLGQRLAPYSDELVPEMIILNGREGEHEEALRLLTHGLGDYDTAIRYCLLSGSSIFHPGSGLADEPPLPTKEEQARLFEYLLHQFLRIEDQNERLERTAELLERFGGWFDVAKVLDLIPNTWSVELVSGFLIHAFRRLVRERNETVVVKALTSAQNLRQAVDFIGKSEGIELSIVNTEVDVR